MRGFRSDRRGKINPGVALLVVVLTGLALVIGWWYGRGGIELGTKKSGPAQSPRAKWEKPDFKSPSSETNPDASSLILEDRLSDIAEAASRAVVSVIAEHRVENDPGRLRGPNFHFFDPRLPGPDSEPQPGLGSGVIVTADGYVLTNNHVVENASAIKIVMGDQTEHRGVVVGSDPETDVAVLKIEGKDFPTLALADSDRVRVGQVVLAIGAPFGLSQSVTMGIVSARGRTAVGIADFEDFIQTDAAINPGNSGGALINLAGDMIGVNTAIFSQSGGYMGIGFAIPSNLARKVMESLIRDGRVKRGWLGVQIQDINQDFADMLGLETPKGALVSEVFPDTPAEKAGIRAEDVIVAVNGKEVGSAREAMNQVANLDPESEATITVVREGKKMELRIKLGARPAKDDLDEAPQPGAGLADSDFAGMRVAELDEELAAELGLDRPVPGVVVLEIQPGSRAARSNLAPFDLIVGVNRQKVVDLKSFKAAVAKAGEKSLYLQVKRGGRNMFVIIPAE